MKRFQSAILLVVCSALLVILYAVLKPGSSIYSIHSNVVAVSRPQIVSTYFTLHDYTVTGGLRQIDAREGDTIVLTVLSNVRGDLYVHGYEKTVSVSASLATELSFTANSSGRYPVHFHTETGAHVYLADLNVVPK